MENKALEILDRQVKLVLNNQLDSKIVYDARKVLSDTLLTITGQKNRPQRKPLKR